MIRFDHILEKIDPAERNKRYITSTSQTLQSSEELTRLIAKHCREYSALSAKNVAPLIYRGVKSTENYLLVDPKRMLRKSTSGMYWQWINEYVSDAPEWSEFPKRVRSLICTPDVYKAGTFVANKDTPGAIYQVIPFDGSRWGVAPKIDFMHVTFGHSDVTLGEILEIARFMVRKNNISNNSMYKMFTYQRLKPILTKQIVIDKMIEEVWSIVNKYQDDQVKLPLWMPFFPTDFCKHLTSLQSEFGNEITLGEVLGKIYDPLANEFEVSTYEGLIKYSHNELWTDSRCILVKAEIK